MQPRVGPRAGGPRAALADRLPAPVVVVAVVPLAGSGRLEGRPDALGFLTVHQLLEAFGADEPLQVVLVQPHAHPDEREDGQHAGVVVVQAGTAGPPARLS
eukprot:scaffold100171_cov34-Prasinocladus_malaysianus.AAC.1